MNTSPSTPAPGPTTTGRPGRRPSRTSRAARVLVAASITGAVAVAGAASASAAPASAARAVDPGLAQALRPALPVPGPLGPNDPGNCMVCGLGGFDPVLGAVTGPVGS